MCRALRASSPYLFHGGEPLSIRKPMDWNFAKRADSRIAITLDNNVWNFFFEAGTKLCGELPRERFVLFITREVEIETLAIPNEEAKTGLKRYIAETIESCGI